ncbi:MAG: hypothetical protein K2L10_04515 [Ruminococcus sp.]|nr:hypothetical protein [Ruminococcus sp.]
MERISYSKPEVICDCANCPQTNTCKYRHKFQRLPRKCGGLGLCPNLPENKKK